MSARRGARESPNPRARQPDRRRCPARDRLRKRLHRAAGGRLDRLPGLRGLLLRALPGGAPRRPADGAERGPVPATDGRAADRGRPHRDLPARPDRRFPPGALDRRRRGRAGRDAVLPAPRLPAARELQVPLRARVDRAARAACAAGDRPGGQRRASLDPLRLAAVPARRARQGAADRVPRRLSAREARGAGPGTPEGLRPAARDLGRRDARPRRDERSRVGAPLLRDLSVDALRGHRPADLHPDRRRPLRRRRGGRVQADLACPHARRDLARPVAAHPHLGLPDHAVALLDLERGLRGRRPRQGHVHDDRRRDADSLREHRLHLLGDRAGARPDRRRRVAARLHALHRAWDEGRDARRRWLLEAPRRGADVLLRAADLHHRGRDPPDDPADGRDAPVRQLRRVERRRELRPARGAAADLEPFERGGPVNRQIAQLALLGLALIGALIVGTTYWQTWANAGLADRQDNAIRLVAQFSIKRGKIYASDGTLLAANVTKHVGGQTLYFRRYPTGPIFSDVVGYSTQSRNQTGLERSYNDYLTGSNANLDTVFHATLDRLKGSTVQGNNVYLTLRPGAQALALRELRGKCGAVVAMNPTTGAVYVLASSPPYNPNLIEKHYQQALRSGGKCGALLNRATAGKYQPGSSFKVVTATAALNSGRFTPDSTV